MRLKRNIRSTVRPSLVYGYAGDEVKVISVHGDVLIVEGNRGNRYSVLCSDVTGNEAEIIFEAVPDTTAVFSNKRAVSKKAPAINQNTLF